MAHRDTAQVRTLQPEQTGRRSSSELRAVLRQRVISVAPDITAAAVAFRAQEPKVLGVNLVQKVPDPLERTARPLLNHGPDVEAGHKIHNFINFQQRSIKSSICIDMAFP